MSRGENVTALADSRIQTLVGSSQVLTYSILFRFDQLAVVNGLL